MRPFYDTVALRSALITEARSWIGTPFRAYAGEKRTGTDCVHFVAACYVATGLMKSFEPPKYGIRDGDCLTVSAVEAFIESMGCFAHLPLGQSENLGVQTGDVVCLKMGRVSHHVGLVSADDFFVHSYQTMGTVECCLRDPTWRQRVQKIYRPVI